MKEQVINAFGENKVLYWLLGFLLAVMIALYNDTQTVRNERLDKIEADVGKSANKSYVDDKFKIVDKKIDDVNQASNAAIERVTKRQDEILSKINDIYIMLLKEQNDKD